MHSSTTPERINDSTRRGDARDAGRSPEKESPDDGAAAPSRSDSPVGEVRQAGGEESVSSRPPQGSDVATGSDPSESEAAAPEATASTRPSSTERSKGEGDHADPAPAPAEDDDEDEADRPTVWVSRPVEDDDTGAGAKEEATTRPVERDRKRDGDPDQAPVAAPDEREPEQAEPAEQEPKHRSEKMRLLAFNMAVRGTKLKDVKEQLREEFELTASDAEALDLIVEEAFDKAASWRLPLPHGRRRRFLSR